MSKLTAEEIAKISQLLLSDNVESALLGYELIKQNPSNIDTLQKELVLILTLHSDKILTRRVRAFLSARFKKSGLYDGWIKAFELFQKIKNAYSMTAPLQEAIDLHETVRKEYQPLIERNVYYSKQYFEIARILHYSIKSHFTLCADYYKIAIAGNPYDYNAWFNLGHLAQNQLKESELSVACYEEVLKLNPNMAAAHNNMGVIKEVQNQEYEKAYTYFKKALDLSPHYTLYKCNMANIALRLGKTNEFEELIESVFATDRYYSRAVNQWANYLWEYKKDYAEAEKEYKKGLSFYPNNIHLLGNLGEMYATVYGRYEEALDLYKRAIKEEKSLYRLTTLVSLLVVDMNCIEEALPFYAELKQIQADTGKIKDHDLKDFQWAAFLKAEKLLLEQG